MLGQFLKTDPALSRYRAAPFGPFLDGYIKARLEKGFAKPTLRRALQIITAFGEHLTALGVESVSDLDESYCDAFIDHYRSHARSAGTKRRSPRGSVSLKEVLRGSLRGLLAHLRGIGAIKSLQEASTPHSELVEEYVEFLRRHRGFADLTVAQHRNWASTFSQGPRLRPASGPDRGAFTNGCPDHRQEARGTARSEDEADNDYHCRVTPPVSSQRGAYPVIVCSFSSPASDLFLGPSSISHRLG